MLKVGDVVICSGYQGAFAGHVGIIRTKHFGDYGVEFKKSDEEDNGHNLNDVIKNNNGWYCPPERLRLHKENLILCQEDEEYEGLFV